MRQNPFRTFGKTGHGYYIAVGSGVGAYARDDDHARELLMEYFRAEDYSACMAEWARLGYRVRLENPVY